MTRITADWLQSKASQKLFDLLESAGHKVFFVGGCVRNELLGAPVSDLDVSTDATPDQVISITKGAGLRAIPTGIEHGTVTVIVDDISFEITTFRKDIETDGRRAVVAFSNSIEDDARRRDFTMNALYADRNGDVIDPVGGIPDLESRRVRFIDDAEQRIKEDYLRSLRFFRFHAWYGDQAEGLDADGFAACAAQVDGLDSLSKERVGQEMKKLLAAPDPSPAMASMAACGALLRILPGADASVLPVLVHIEPDAGLAPDAMRRLAAIGGAEPVKNLRLSNAESRLLDTLLTDLDPIELGYRFSDLAASILAIRAVSVGAKINHRDLEDAKLGIGKSFPVKADDLMPAYTGPELGKALSILEARWIKSRFELTKEALIAGYDIQE